LGRCFVNVFSKGTDNAYSLKYSGKSSSIMMNSERFKRVVLAAIFVFSAGEFIFDLSTRLGPSSWVWYVIPLLLSLSIGGRFFPYLLAAIFSVLMLAALCFSPPGLDSGMAFVSRGMFFLFLSTGPVNTLILETTPVNLRASAMAVSIFAIHLFGDMWSPQIVGRLADSFGGNLQKAVLILPMALVVASVFWLVLAVKTRPAPHPGR
jgi:hypothetical protein